MTISELCAVLTGAKMLQKWLTDKAMRWATAVSLMAFICPLVVLAQSGADIPAACDLSDHPPQRRFYQRGNAPDDLTDDDLWQDSTLDEQGIDEALLAEGLAQLAESPTRQSLLLMRNGQLVL